MKKIIVVTAAVLALLAVFAAGCGNMPDDTAPEAADDEIALHIQLNLKEDIGLLVVDYYADGTTCSGGVSNADKSMLKRDELIIYTLSRQSFDAPEDVEELSVRFTVITEYVDPNYENIYPAEYTKPMEAISLRGKFGESYYVTISGDRENGYHAVLEEDRGGEGGKAD